MSKVETIYLKDYQKPDFKILDCELTFELLQEHTIVTNVMKFKKSNADTKNLSLDALELELLELWLNDLKLKESRFVIEDEKLIVLNVPDEFSLKVVNKIYPQNNTELEGLYKSGAIFCTQNEPEGFRKITPFIDRPDNMSLFSTTIIADKKRYPVLLSNGNKKTASDLQDGKHSVTWQDPYPKPSYLFALVAGDLGVVSDEFTTASGIKIELNIYCDLGNESKCFHAMKSLKESMLWDEQKYGREYDLEIYNIVAVDSFNMGAMENKGLNIFNSHYVLADKDSATDANFMGIQSVIAHEYFHNWTGNRITCRDWFQLTLKEGLTVFRDQSFSADMNSKEVARIEDVKALRDRQFVEDASATAHPIQPDSYMAINNFYTATVYEKGAEVIRMIYTLLGEKNFRKAMDLYFESFDGQAVTTDDFLWAMSKASKEDLSEFKRWYHQVRTPKLKVDEVFEDGSYKLTLTQIIPDAVDSTKQKPYYFPLKMALLDRDAKELKLVCKNQDRLKDGILIVSKEKEEFVFESIASKPVLSINRDFSAPIIVDFKDSDLAFLMKHDRNSFVRYESAQSFAIQTLEAMMQGKEINKEFVDAYGYLLDLDVELNYKALLLELPCVSTLMQRQSKVDFEPIYSMKEKLTKHLANVYKDKLIELYHKNHFAENSDIDAKSMGQRALKNRVLALVCELKDAKLLEMANAQYKNSLTMTDKIAALSILQDVDAVSSKEALADFYAKYKDDTLVMNKYFAIFASSKREGTLQKVQELQSDAVYDEKVPNLVRSLIGSFARNYRYFHAKDASGYKFIADKIIAIDKINAQMASGLAGAFKVYERLNPTNKALMHKELDRILSTSGLSKNVYEIISKILKRD